MRQYTVAILLALACGPLLGSVPLFTHTVIGGVGLRTSHALSIIGVSGALLMLWLLSHRAARQIPEDGKGLTFARAILPPLATVILVFIGYQMLLLLDGPVFGARERSVYRSGYLVGIMGAAAWLTLTWVRNAGALTKFVEVRLSNGERMDATLRLPRSAETTSTVITGARKDADGAGILDSRSMASSLGRYEIVKELGRGSMGVVYLGKDPTINRSVAIKTMRLDQIDDPDELKEFKERFFREAESTGRLSHPNIVTIYDAGEERALGYIAMELLEGVALSAWCRKERLLPVKRAMEIVATVAEALDYAHGQGVVHRDVKPANIMVGKNGTVKVMDFGIARMTTANATQTKVIIGTPSYMSPEQLNGITVDGRSDVFSAGAVLFELMTGEKLFEADTISSLLFKIAHERHRSAGRIRPDLPSCCETILDRSLAKDCADRYRTAGELAQALRACLSSLPG